MYDEKAIQILQIAIKKSQARDMKWDVNSSGNEAVYVHRFPSGYELRAFPHTFYEDPEGEGPPSLTVFDPQQKLVLDITVEITGVDREELVLMYRLAKRSAEGIDQKLDQVLEDLKNTSDADIPF